MYDPGVTLRVSRPAVTSIVRREHHVDVLPSQPMRDLQTPLYRMTGKGIGDDYLLKDVSGFDMPIGTGERRSEPESVMPDYSGTAF